MIVKRVDNKGISILDIAENESVFGGGGNCTLYSENGKITLTFMTENKELCAAQCNVRNWCVGYYYNPF